MKDADRELGHKLERAWSRSTSSLWTRDNPARGQCGVTSLAVQDRLGGAILKTRVGDAWHFYNLIDAVVIDFTASQFSSAVVYDDLPATREEAMSDTSPEQYAALIHALDS